MNRNTRSLTIVAVVGLLLAYLMWSWRGSRPAIPDDAAPARAVSTGTEVAAAELLDPGARLPAEPARPTDAAVLQPAAALDAAEDSEPSEHDPAATAQLWSDSRVVATRVFDGSVGEDELMELSLRFLRLSEGREFVPSADPGSLMIELFTEPGGGRLELRMRPGAKGSADELQLITSMTDSPLTQPQHPHTGQFIVKLGTDEEGGVSWETSAMDHVMPTQDVLDSLSGQVNVQSGGHMYRDETGFRWVPMETSYVDVDGKPGVTLEAGDSQARYPSPSSASTRESVNSQIAALRRRMSTSLLEDD